LRVENWSHVTLLIFYAPITAAFCEEFLYRGFAITVLNNVLGNIWIAGVISSVIFALMHIPRHGLGGFVSTGTVGLLLMIIFVLTESLYPGILVHSIVDFVGFVIIPVVRSKKTI
jgi:membrane protease YdiL (CAAX protease family)